MSNKISACLIVRNEEKMIEKCLNSIKDVVDEIIIVHDGKCSDKTLEICKKYTNNVFIRKYVGVAEPHRPFSYKTASYEWILQIDADEYLSDDLRNNLKKLVEKKNIDAFEFYWPFWDGENYVNKYWSRKMCLFRKSKIFILGIPHFPPKTYGAAKKSNLILYHQYGNKNAKDFLKNKWIKWAKLHAKIYLRGFDKVKKYNYKEYDWPAKIKLRIKFPILLMPADFFILFFKEFFGGQYKNGFIGIKNSFWSGVYRILLDYYIFIYKSNL